MSLSEWESISRFFIRENPYQILDDIVASRKYSSFDSHCVGAVCCIQYSKLCVIIISAKAGGSLHISRVYALHSTSLCLDVYLSSVVCGYCVLGMHLGALKKR